MKHCIIQPLVVPRGQSKTMLTHGLIQEFVRVRHGAYAAGQREIKAAIQTLVSQLRG
jgi:hypothetical protein